MALVDHHENSIKVVLLGDSGVGKSSLALRFVADEFRPYSQATIGASFMSKTVSIPDNSSNTSFSNSASSSSNSTTDNQKSITFKIWDTAGQEKYHSLAPMYYRGAAAAILVYDMGSPSSFHTLQNWADELKSNGPPNLVMGVCGNKNDLPAIEKKVAAEQARNYANRVGAFFMETSARNNTNVHELFQEVARRVPARPESDNPERVGSPINFAQKIDDSRPCGC